LLPQPIGTGLSLLGNDSIPSTLQQSTQQLYQALQGFFGHHSELQARPFFIAGEVTWRARGRRAMWC
jgi:carboxypeptidase C (cathepsin A)